ncbi:MAG: glycosyltransferase family 4 protein [Pirellulales bacterium]|jgi:glycosyltransferase involved in cell wall biosynthesis|nr:glycosyltransferase family 4 protein [Pirellulales bacterium]
MMTTPTRPPESVAGLPADRPLRVTYLTSGAAGMFCGSCIHDNTLARGLRSVGIDVQLVPTYTPIRTDEPDSSVPLVFFGGLNVYFAQKIPGFARLPRVLTNWLDRPGVIRFATSFGIQTDAHELGALTVSMLRGEHGNQSRDIARLVAWLETQPHPDVVHFTNLLIGGCIPLLKQRLGVRVVVTLQGDDIFLDSLPEPYRSRAVAEMQRLVPYVDRFIVNSNYYADEMAGLLAIPRNQFDVSPLTIDTGDFLQPGDTAIEANAHRPAERTIGYLARLAPEKGLHLLVDAFCRLKQRPNTEHIRLKIAGWLGVHRREFADEQFQILRTAGLADAFEHVGEVDRVGKVDFLRQIDLLCVPTTYRDPKGLFALESLASGTPVVLPAHGAFPEMLDRLGGGRLVPPDDPEALADALLNLLNDDDTLRSLGRSGQQQVHQLAGMDALVTSTQATYARVLSVPPASP